MTLIFVFLFLAITFGYSAFEKAIDFKGSVAYYQTYLANTFLRKYVRPILFLITGIEAIATLFMTIGIFEVFIKKDILYGYLGLILASSTLLCFLVGQRLTKDYEGARGIAIYMIICLIGLVLIEFFH